MLKALVPPIVWTSLRSLKRKYKTYPSWAAASAAAGTYDNDVLTSFRVARAGASVPLLDNALAWLPGLLGGHLAIVDFGGATGETGAALRKAGADVSYTVVEHPALVALMAARGENFTASIPDACDVFYTSGTLHYLADPFAALDHGFSSAKKAVVLRRNNFSEREIFRVQIMRLFENGSGPIPPGFKDIEIAYPNRTISEKEVLEMAGRHGFYLFARTPEMDGVPIPQDDIYGAQLVFLKQ
jgi:putative methyltransferase (TIGR04325 family)